MNSAGPRASTSAGVGSKDVDARENAETSTLFDESSFFANISAAASPGPRANRSADTSALNVSALCCDEELNGFDRLSGRTWIYPTNYPVRDYQFNIIKATILKNTLVSLPTGLGKTFIAAVIMYNYYRWYPLGKIVFTAPTRPLVAQQINACYDIVAIPKADTIEMTGHMQVATRKMHWKDKRVFFATPQVIYNDLKSGICPAERIRCLVLDEAHRARGNYAYCQIVSALDEIRHTLYRVLALSATPGSKVEDVINVVRSLHIAHLELRTENCIDVQRYSHTKKIETVVIPLGDQLNHLRQQYVEILDTYARRLKQLNILGGNMGNLSKGRIVMLYKEFQMRERGARHPQHNYIMKDFTVLISLYHGLELLSKHGSRVFLNFFDEHPEKQWIQADNRLTALLERLRDDLGVNPLALDRSTLPDGTVAPIPKDITFGHPKFDRLRTILTKHFNDAKDKGKETKAIVFCEYRESVNLVHCLLLQCRPLIQPQMFVGQGASGKDGAAVVSQKGQLRVMRQFREGACNVLVATCVAEEGLDVGSVDLIVCFDISTRSPVRLVQRCGRTGRERGGHVYILVTEGREHQTLQDCMRQRDNLNSRIMQSRDVQSALYASNPRMIPHDFTPQCQKMHITVNKQETKEKSQKKSGQKDLRSMLTDRLQAGPSTSTATVCSIITKEEFEKLYHENLPREDYFEGPKELWASSVEVFKSRVNKPRNGINLSEWLEWQRTPQSTVRVEHSCDASLLSELLQYADTKRFCLPPSTQNPNFNTQMLNTQTPLPPPEPKKKAPPAKRKTKLTVEPTRTDGDIRALFSTTKKSTKQYTKAVKDLGIDSAAGLPTSLIDLMVDLCVQDDEMVIECKTCRLLDCCLLHEMKKKNDKKTQPPLSILKGLTLPNIDLLDLIDLESIEKAGLNTEDKIECDVNSSEDIFLDECFINDDLFPKDNILLENQASTGIKESANKINCTSNFDLAFDFDFDGSDVEEGKSHENNISTSNFDVGCLEDIFHDSNSASDSEPKENDETIITEDNKKDPKQALEFFGLDSIDDIFADSNDDDVEIIETPPIFAKNQPSPTYTEDPIPKPIQEVRSQSPSLLAGTQVVNNTIVCSPILCSQRNQQVMNKNSSTSPILCSQRNRLSLNKSFSAKSSTPLLKPNTQMSTLNNVINIDENSMDWSDIQEIPTERTQDNTIHRKSEDTTGSKSMLTITQIIDNINKPTQSDENKAKDVQNKTVASTSKFCENRQSKTFKNENTKDFENRSISPILFTQVDRDRSITTSQFISKTNLEKDHITDTTNNLSSSPIISTQMDRNRTAEKSKGQSKSENKNKSVIILDSDSDETVTYDLTPQSKQIDCPNITVDFQETNGDNSRVKRKFNSEDSFSSPYFPKRQKINNSNKPSLSLKDKLKSIFSDSKINKSNDPQIFTATTGEVDFQKENRSPNKPSSLQLKTFNDSLKSRRISFDDLDFEEDLGQIKSQPIDSQCNVAEKLQAFRRDCKESLQKRYASRTESISQFSIGKSNRTQTDTVCSDSDDDFVLKDSYQKKTCRKDSPAVNYKVRKKKAKGCDFLDLSAEVSDASRDSGDEMSDDSLAGSIVNFICDETHNEEVDMQAHYLRSVKSPVKGMFKIPDMPHRFANVLSQPERNDDNYEIDSFCVEGNVGLTQAQDVSVLELAERRLRRRRKLRKTKRQKEHQSTSNHTTDSPIAKPRQAVRRLISSDSGSDD